MQNRAVKIIFISFLLLLIGRAGETEEATPIQNVERYFPDDIGLSWTFSGTVADQVQKVAAYTNVATVKGTAEKNGVQVKVFSETNQANEGPTDSYFFRDRNGIIYHGGEPMTPFEKQLVPYRVIRFPMVLHQTFSQIQKDNISFGQDLDNDGQDEQAQVRAEITAAGLETVAVPAGVFKDCLKLQGTLVVQVTLSKNQKVVQLIDKTTNWFAPGVGLIKGIERIEYPAVDGGNPTGNIITEELTEYSQGKSSVH
ncbi:MAG TPA: hypothetical protein VFA47_05770 [Candidatus Manganitrophaceae bacterium]|nr:hypothetical protein [Candidatus Manganitrophaceae bacterium]